ncbi:hypothetical protein [Nitratireductor sp. ZSWI3]|uniref:hypothetical protein n=1 Tax=Nitratireductor sp. ZSWI3 TaxID=2966359 RepID=UPI00214FA22A|nr:hypothetical protein [Nitratireductor sp. ZSWI3]MCR4267966.1 hypothetical protein [Nitratireductor sp. ZSWI3]
MPSRLPCPRPSSLAGLVLAAGLQATALPAAAQDGAAPAINLELNGLQDSDKGCRIAFVVENGLPRDIGKAAYEIALFDKAGMVDRLLVLDFQDLPAAKTKVKRFDLADAECGAIGRVLVNDASACEGDGIAPGDCIARLNATTRSGVAFGK